jgi:diguanylate cyclase (GGDEF)-like protein
MQIKTAQSSLILLYRMLIISTLLALIAILTYFILPERKLRMLPDLAEESHLFFDAEQGGKTMAEWVDRGRFDFVCRATADGIAAPYCGLSINFREDVDYSHYQHMELKIHYKGSNERLRLKMHSFKPSDAEDSRETLQGLDVSFLALETRELMTVNNYGWGILAGRLQGIRSTRDSAVTISIDLVPPIVAGEHHIQLDYIEISGKLLAAESWYLGVAILWLMSNLLFITRHLMLQEKRIRNDSHRLVTLAHYSDDLQQESQRYKLLSSTDSLTGALNRNGFATEMSQRAPTGRMPLNTMLMIIDLDHFKKVNDNYGHDAGDAVLREAAQAINKNIRATDRFIRWGGEEFLLFCENTNEQQALLIAEKIRASVEAMSIRYHDELIPVTVSIGIGVAIAHEDFDILFQRTDSALYRAKNLGRNCIVLSDAEDKPQPAD